MSQLMTAIVALNVFFVILLIGLLLRCHSLLKAAEQREGMLREALAEERGQRILCNRVLGFGFVLFMISLLIIALTVYQSGGISEDILGNFNRYFFIWQ